MSKRLAPILVISGGLALGGVPVAAIAMTTGSVVQVAGPKANPNSFYHGAQRVTLTVKANPDSFYHG